jgi:hypothetical protein
MATTEFTEPSLLDRMELSKVSAHLRQLFRRSKAQRKRNSKRHSISGSKAQPVTRVSQASYTSAPRTPTGKLQKALIVARKGAYEIVDDYAIPELQNEDEVMIRSCAVGLNPIDWKSVSYNFCLPNFPWVCLHLTVRLDSYR